MTTATLSDPRSHTTTAPAGYLLAAEPSLSASAFVWGVWAIMSLMALRFAWRLGSEVPFWEEWLFVPCVLGAEPFSLSWLWDQYLDHRAPLHKLLLYLSFSAFGLDERPVLLLDVGLFAALAAALIWAVRKVRGRASYADAFFPIILLNFGHSETFYWAGTNVYVMSTFLSGMILVVLFVTGGRFTPRSAALAGVCLVLLPLIFGGGVLYAACLSCGLGAFGVAQVRSAEPADRRAGRVLLAFVGVSLVIVAFYFVGYHPSRLVKPGGSQRPAAVLKTTITFLIQAYGLGGRYPYDRLMKQVTMALLTIAWVCLAVGVLRHRTGGTRPLLGLGLFFGSSLFVALVVGYGRAAWGPDALTVSRYSAPAVPTLLCLYLIWEACGPRRVRSFGRAALGLMAFAFLAPNWGFGRDDGWRHREVQDAFLADVRAGVPIPQLVARHGMATYYVHEKLESYLRLLRDRRYGDYARIPADPSFREIPLTAPASSATGVVWDGKRGRSTSDGPELIFDLPRPTRVAGIRMKYSNVNPGGWVPAFDVGWRMAGDEQPGKTWKTYEHWHLKPDGKEVTVPVWIDATVDRIRIRPDKRPCDFSLSDIVLLMSDPPANNPPSPTDKSQGNGETASSPAP